MKFEGCVVNHRFLVSRTLGSGTFCDAFRAEDRKTSVEVVVKFFTRNESTFSVYDAEVAALSACNHLPGFPILLDNGIFQTIPYIVTDYRGEDLMQSLFLKNQVIEVEAAKLIAVKLLSVLEALHDKGFLHLDIKADNILVDASGQVLSLIDYGFSQSYLSGGRHYAETGWAHRRGNSVFCSSSCLRGMQPSRRSDIESLAYTLIFIEKGNLPWTKCVGFGARNVEMCLSLRQNFLRSEFMATVNPASRTLLAYALALKFDQAPAYQYLKDLFATQATEVKFYSRKRAGRGTFVPNTCMLRGKSAVGIMPDRSDSPHEPSPKRFSSKRNLLLTVDKPSNRGSFSKSPNRDSERKRTKPDRTGPSFSDVLRQKIMEIKGDSPTIPEA